MRVVDYKKAIKNKEERMLWKKHLRNEITLTNKQLDEVLQKKDIRK